MEAIARKVSEPTAYCLLMLAVPSPICAKCSMRVNTSG